MTTVDNEVTNLGFFQSLKELMELEHEVIEAYELAIKKLTYNNYRIALQEFLHDHIEHVTSLNEVINKRKYAEIHSGGIKQWLTKGKIFLANLMNKDEDILQAMLANEKESNEAYEKINADDTKWEETVLLLAYHWDDEKRHKTWLENILKQ